MKYDTVLFLRTPGQELLHSIIRFLYLKEAIFTKEELCHLIFISNIIFIAFDINYSPIWLVHNLVKIARYVMYFEGLLRAAFVIKLSASYDIIYIFVEKWVLCNGRAIWALLLTCRAA